MESSLIILVLTTILALSSSCQSVSAATLGGNEEVAKVCSINKWRSFKEKYNRNYDEKSTEDKSRLAIFCKNLQRVVKHNENSNATYTLNINEFSDRTPEELLQYTGGLSPNNTSIKMLRSSLNMRELNSSYIGLINGNSDEIPDEVDWSKDPSRVAKPRFQGECGSCWAFATIAMLEGQEKPKSGPLVELSEQNLVDCDDKNYGCNGGYFSLALEQIKVRGGVMRLADYPYTSGETRKKGQCKMDRTNVFKTTTNLGETRLLEQGNEELLKRVVATYGPVAVGIHATEDLHYYEKGIYYNGHCEGNPNHAITIVGYGTDKNSGLDYWKVKNSWSDEWGYHGYGYIARNKNNYCQIASMAYITLPPE